jgi:TM2 domain-containing membrane protein YozV
LPPLSKHPTHSLAVGYLLWLFGFLGMHRFYYGKQLTGALYFFTLGLLGLGWLFDLFWMPVLQRHASRIYKPGRHGYTPAWILLVFTGYLGLHRFYLGKWKSGLLWLFTLGLFGIGWQYDLWTLNWQVSQENIKK